jgi:hypothetical protein
MQKLLAVGLFSLALATPALAQQHIKVSGCAIKGVEAGCVMLRTVSGKTYNVTYAWPKPEPVAYGTVEGYVSGGPNTCQQGILLDSAHWTRIGPLCPLHKGKK